MLVDRLTLSELRESVCKMTMCTILFFSYSIIQVGTIMQTKFLH